MTVEIKISVLDELSNNNVEEIINLISKSSETDGVRPFSEHVELHLKSGGDLGVKHFLALAQSQKIVGYGHLDSTDEVEGPSCEIAVDPAFRNKGIATKILSEINKSINQKPLRIWSHGDIETAQKFAQKLNLTPVRSVMQMRRSLFSPFDTYSFNEKFTLRNFELEKDADELLALNKLSFVNLPDQFSWTKKSLEIRVAESWFDPKGFILLENEKGELIGFCWTKLHGQHHSHEQDDGHSHLTHGHVPIGEIYVLGVHPNYQGQGIGKNLTLWGLTHLRRSGIDSAMLYVDAANQNAIKLYTSLEFGFWGLDKLYRSLT